MKEDVIEGGKMETVEEEESADRTAARRDEGDDD